MPRAFTPISAYPQSDAAFQAACQGSLPQGGDPKGGSVELSEPSELSDIEPGPVGRRPAMATPLIAITVYASLNPAPRSRSAWPISSAAVADTDPFCLCSDTAPIDFIARLLAQSWTRLYRPSCSYRFILALSPPVCFFTPLSFCSYFPYFYFFSLYFYLYHLSLFYFILLLYIFIFFSFLSCCLLSLLTP